MALAAAERTSCVGMRTSVRGAGRGVRVAAAARAPAARASAAVAAAAASPQYKGPSVWTHPLVKEGAGVDMMNSTYMPAAADYAKVDKTWVVVDAQGAVLGRLGTVVADLLRGSNSPSYTPHAPMGVNVVVINADKVIVTGNKYTEKVYKRHTTGRPGAMHVEAFDKLQARIPERIVEKCVKGMLPKNALGRELFRSLYVYKGPEHPHAAQEPVDVTDMYKRPRATKKSGRA